MVRKYFTRHKWVKFAVEGCAVGGSAAATSTEQSWKRSHGEPCTQCTFAICARSRAEQQSTTLSSCGGSRRTVKPSDAPLCYRSKWLSASRFGSHKAGGCRAVPMARSSSTAFNVDITDAPPHPPSPTNSNRYRHPYSSSLLSTSPSTRLSSRCSRLGRSACLRRWNCGQWCWCAKCSNQKCDGSAFVGWH